MTTARRRALVGLLSLALVASAQACMATSAIAADAPAPAPAPAPAASTDAVGTTAVTFTTAPQPSITGTAQVGSTLFAVTGTWAPQPDSFTFKWWSNGVAISGASGSAYTLVAADLGKKITLTVTDRGWSHMIEIANGAVAARAVKPEDPADFKFEGPFEIWGKIAAGQTDFNTAVITGKMKFKGSLPKIMGIQPQMNKLTQTAKEIPAQAPP